MFSYLCTCVSVTVFPIWWKRICSTNPNGYFPTGRDCLPINSHCSSWRTTFCLSVKIYTAFKHSKYSKPSECKRRSKLTVLLLSSEKKLWFVKIHLVAHHLNQGEIQEHQQQLLLHYFVDSELSVLEFLSETHWILSESLCICKGTWVDPWLSEWGLNTSLSDLCIECTLISLVELCIVVQRSGLGIVLYPEPL